MMIKEDIDFSLLTNKKPFHFMGRFFILVFLLRSSFNIDVFIINMLIIFFG